MDDLILASASIGRKKLFERDFASFRIIISDIDESKITESDPIKLVKILSLLKAEKVAETHPDDFVIGFDTVVVCDSGIIGKPKDKNEAKRILRRISGKEQSVITGFAVICLTRGIQINEYDETALLFNEMDDMSIDEYVEDHPVTKFAGGYGVQDNDRLIKIISGDMDNVIGAPMQRIREVLKQFRDKNYTMDKILS